MTSPGYRFFPDNFFRLAPPGWSRLTSRHIVPGGPAPPWPVVFPNGDLHRWSNLFGSSRDFLNGSGRRSATNDDDRNNSDGRERAIPGWEHHLKIFAKGFRPTCMSNGHWRSQELRSTEAGFNFKWRPAWSEARASSYLCMSGQFSKQFNAIPIRHATHFVCAGE